MTRRQSVPRAAPPRILATTHGGKPALMIFVDGEFGYPKLDRVVRNHRRGYAAYWPGEKGPFLVARELSDAVGSNLA